MSINLLWDKANKVYPNNDPCVTKDVKLIINLNKQIVGHGDKENLKSVQKELDEILKRAKEPYERKIQKHFPENNMKHGWGRELNDEWVFQWYK